MPFTLTELYEKRNELDKQINEMKKQKMLCGRVELQMKYYTHKNVSNLYSVVVHPAKGSGYSKACTVISCCNSMNEVVEQMMELANDLSTLADNMKGE